MATWWPSGLMDKASASGAGDCGFESHLGRVYFPFQASYSNTLSCPPHEALHISTYSITIVTKSAKQRTSEYMFWASTIQLNLQNELIKFNNLISTFPGLSHFSPFTFTMTHVNSFLYCPCFILQLSYGNISWPAINVDQCKVEVSLLPPSSLVMSVSWFPSGIFYFPSIIDSPVVIYFFFYCLNIATRVPLISFKSGQI